jgi:polar amino acid transport system ATP-binding protein
MIEFRNVTKFYGSFRALDDVTETIARGEVVVICGPSGSGKSTLIRTINRLEPIDSGQILLYGEDIHRPKLDVDRFRSGIGFVFQQFNLFPHLSVLENGTLAPMKVRGLSEAAARERALALLERVGLAGKAQSYPAQLSGGQQQRVAIARALVTEPDLILADEPTGNLDSSSTADVLSLLRDLHHGGRTIVLITHEPDVAAMADRVVTMHDGRVLEHELA